jgi:Ca-activated chloride channel family protein
MEHLTFAYSFLFPWLAGAGVVAAGAAFFMRRRMRYRYALASEVGRSGMAMRIPARQILYLLRLCSLLILGLLVARPQWVDTQRQTIINGVDMVLTLDISGSMQLFDDPKHPVQRIESMRAEALDFIAKRTDDPIGIVIFGAQALSKVPLTLDKTLLNSVVRDLEIGDVDSSDTLLLTAVATAINRLRTSQAQSKVIVLLTDGVPSERDPIEADVVIQLAQEFGIKIYTLGVGGDQVAYTYDNWGRLAQVPSQVATELLEQLAKETGGKHFRVKTPSDLKRAYSAIDALEKTEITTPLFQKYYEAYASFIWWFLALFALELFLRLFLWWGLL